MPECQYKAGKAAKGPLQWSQRAMTMAAAREGPRFDVLSETHVEPRLPL